MEKQQLNRERYTLLLRLEKVMEGPMVFLGFVWLGLLVIEMIGGLNPALEFFSIAIWILFIIDFLVKLVLAPHKGRYLKQNWLTVISLAIPALRVLRVLRVARLLRGLRSVRLIKVVSSVNRSMKSLNATMQRRGFKYIMVLTLVVLFAGSAGMYAFEKDVPNGLNSYANSLWWTSMLLTSLGSEYWPQTPEGRALCLLISIYGFCVFGYITATLASLFIGQDAERKDAPVVSKEDIAALKTDIERLTIAVQQLNGPT